MKKSIAAGLMAICLTALSQQEASAWVNSKFGIGLSWDWQGGGNSFLWGLWRSSQPPGPEAYGFAPRGPAPGGFPGGGFPGGAPYAPVGPGIGAPLPGGGAYPPISFQQPFIDPNIRAMNYQANPFHFANYAPQTQYQYNPYQYVPYQYYPNR